MGERVTALVPLILLVGCSSPSSAPSVAVPGPPVVANGLVAMVSPGPRLNTVTVEYRNDTHQEVTISRQVVESNVLALEVSDSSGRRMPPVPPSIPWSRDDGVRIPAGGIHRAEYSLEMFSPSLPPGRYRVRVQIKGWACEPLEYTVDARR